jgi:putative transposase
MLQNFQYWIYPTKKQRKALEGTIEECRWLSNHLLEARKTAYEQEGKSLTCYGHQSTYPMLKEQRPSLHGVHSQVLQNVAVRVCLSKIGRINMVSHRPVKGKIKTCTIHRSSTEKWYVTFSVECEPERLEPVNDQVGIDVGLKTFATLSTAEEIENPRFFRKEEKALAKVQREHSKLASGRSWPPTGESQSSLYIARLQPVSSSAVHAAQ